MNATEKLVELTRRAEEANRVANLLNKLNGVTNWGDLEQKVNWQIRDRVFEEGKRIVADALSRELEVLLNVDGEPE